MIIFYLGQCFPRTGIFKKLNKSHPPSAFLHPTASGLYFSACTLTSQNTPIDPYNIHHSLWLTASKCSKTFLKLTFTVSSFTTELTSSGMMTAIHTSEPLLQALWKFRYFLLLQLIWVIFWKSFYSYHIIFLSFFTQQWGHISYMNLYLVCKAVNANLCRFFRHTYAIKSSRMYNCYAKPIKNVFAL